MAQRPKYFIVDAAALPEVFLKVAEAKRMLETGEAATVNQAAKAAELSRSAFYKYKDMVRPFNDALHGRIVTFQMLLKDEPGVLSGLLNLIARSGGNILTINQNIPTGGCAVVTVGTETGKLAMTAEELLATLAGTAGVIRCEILAV